MVWCSVFWFTPTGIDVASSLPGSLCGVVWYNVVRWVERTYFLTVGHPGYVHWLIGVRLWCGMVLVQCGVV